MRITRVTTKTGDGGNTRLGNGQKVGKEHLRVRCLGGLDELNSQLGLTISVVEDGGTKTELQKIQNDLMNISGEISLPDKTSDLLDRNRVVTLEKRIQQMNAVLPKLKEFLLPGGDEFTARLHVTRAVCRRVECDLVALFRTESIDQQLIVYINRLSDFFFVLARYANKVAGNNESIWEHPA